MPGFDPGGSGCPTRRSFLKPRFTGRKKRATLPPASCSWWLIAWSLRGSGHGNDQGRTMLTGKREEGPQRAMSADLLPRSPGLRAALCRKASVETGSGEPVLQPGALGQRGHQGARAPALGPASPPLTTARGWLLTGAPSMPQGPCHPGALDSGAVVGDPAWGCRGAASQSGCYHLGWADARAPWERGAGCPTVRGWHRLLSLPVHAHLLALPITPATRACASSRGWRGWGPLLGSKAGDGSRVGGRHQRGPLSHPLGATRSTRWALWGRRWGVGVGAGVKARSCESSGRLRWPARFISKHDSSGSEPAPPRAQDSAAASAGPNIPRLHR